MSILCPVWPVLAQKPLCLGILWASTKCKMWKLRGNSVAVTLAVKPWNQLHNFCFDRLSRQVRQEQTSAQPRFFLALLAQGYCDNVSCPSTGGEPVARFDVAGFSRSRKSLELSAETAAGLGLLQKSPSLQRLTLDVVPCHAICSDAVCSLIHWISYRENLRNHCFSPWNKAFL